MDCTSLPFTRRVNRIFGSESTQVPFFEFFAFFAVDPKCRFWVQSLGRNLVDCRLAASLIPVADAAGRVRLSLKMRTVEAVIQPNGEVLLVEPVHLASPRRALVTIMEEAPHPHDAAILSEAALGEDWNRPEEDAAWAHLQPGKSS